MGVSEHQGTLLFWILLVRESYYLVVHLGAPFCPYALGNLDGKIVVKKES